MHMTLDDAIEHALEVATKECDSACGVDHIQLAEWLKELKAFRAAYSDGNPAQLPFKDSENLLTETLDIDLFPLYIQIPGFLSKFSYWHSCNGEKVEIGNTFVMKATAIFQGRRITSIMAGESDDPDDWNCPYRYFWAAYDDENLLYLFSQVSEQNHIQICEYMPELDQSHAQIRRYQK